MRALLESTERRKSTGGSISASENVFNWILGFYERSLQWVLRASALTLGILLITIGVNVYLFVDRAEGIFPAAG